MEILDCEQGSPEWFAARLGIVTASEFATVLAEGKGGSPSVTRRTYMYKLIGEILTGDPMYNYQNEHMERGKEMEEEARDAYVFRTDHKVRRVGFIRAGHAGCSPDSLIGDDGGLEIKTALAHIQVARLLDGRLPPEHKAQIQGALWLTERKWWDFVSYCPRAPLFVIRVYRDESYIMRLATEVRRFKSEMDTLLTTLRGEDVKVT